MDSAKSCCPVCGMLFNHRPGSVMACMHRSLPLYDSPFSGQYDYVRTVPVDTACECGIEPCICDEAEAAIIAEEGGVVDFSQTIEITRETFDKFTRL